MITQIVLLARRPDMTHEEWSTYWRETHAPINAKMKECQRYVQYHGIADADGEAPYDGVALLEFADMETLQRGWDSPEGKATADDIPNFLDASKLVMLFCEGHQVI